jgi:site-specific recombinase XerD
MDELSVFIRRFLEYLEIERNCSRLTIVKYQHYLERLERYFNEELKIERPELKDINAENIRKFRLYLSRQPGVYGEMKMVTQGYYVIVLRAFLKWLIKNDKEVMQPEKLEVPKNKDHSLKFLNDEQMDRLLSQPLVSTPIGIRDKTIMELLFSSGLRVSELVSLNRDQIDLKTREFGVIGKGGRSRVVFVSKEAAVWLERYLRERTDKMKPLFINYAKGRGLISTDEKARLSTRAVEYIIKRYVRQAKIPVAATPHTLRHSMATDLLRAGADLRSVQEILGHKNIATTQIYTHVTDARLREVHEKFHHGNR